MEAFPRQPRHAKAPPRQREAIVAATARLHFGFIDPSGRSALPFGSFGLSLIRRGHVSCFAAQSASR